jgi:chromosome segregation ATPase
MEFAQLESRISFLDSEYRREKADLAQLRHRLDLSEGEREELLKRIEALEAELLAHKSETQRINLLETKIERFKTEVMSALENQQTKQRQVVKEVERSRNAEMESHTKAINEIRREVERSRNLDELITLARTETERQSGVLISFQQRLDTLARQIDEQLRSISYLEEQRRADAKRVSELQAETPDLFKRINLQSSKIELLEQQIPQFGQFQLALEENREAIKVEVERVQYQMAQVDRKLKQWDELSASLLRRLEEYESRMERYAEHYQMNRKSLETLENFQEKLYREQREFIELQRLAFDRQQSKLQEWEAIQEKSIRDQAIEAEKRINEIIKSVKEFQLGFKDVLPRLETQQRQLTLVLKIAEEDALARTISAKEWQTRFEELATEDE